MKLLIILLAIILINAEPAEPVTLEHVAIETVTEPAETVVLEPIGEHVITAYCSCPTCCGKWAENRPNGIVYGAHGVELKQGVSVASPLPAGTVIEIEGLGEYVVHDKTADWIVERYDGRIVDVYFESHEEAARFGKHTRNVTIVSRGK